MRIFLAVRHSKNPTFYYGRLWSDNFRPALEQLGHEVIESQIDLLPASQMMEIANQFTPAELTLRAGITDAILAEVQYRHQEKPIDLFLSYFYNSHFDPGGFAEIHRLGIPTVNFYCNSIYQFHLVADIAPHVNFSWHPEKLARDLYLQVKAHPVWVQMGGNPDLYHPVANQQRQLRACFVGQRYADRAQLLADLLRHQLPVDIYGKGWKVETTARDQRGDRPPTRTPGRNSPASGSWQSYMRLIQQNLHDQGLLGGLWRTLYQAYYRYQNQQFTPLLAGAAQGFAPDLSQTFAQYEVVLNFSHVWADGRPGAKLIPHVRLRDFEAPLCRTCYLTGYTDEIAEFYQIGKEIDCYRNSEELVEKVKFYLNHATEAERLRQAGYQRAIRSHTWQHRFQQLFQKIGIGK